VIVQTTENRLRESMQRAHDLGWVLRRNLWVDARNRSCCAVGSLDLTFSLLPLGVPAWSDEHFAALLGIGGGEVLTISGGFDNHPFYPQDLSEWHAIGRRLWDYAVEQRLTLRPAKRGLELGT
jgi:hypothetical protein